MTKELITKLLTSSNLEYKDVAEFVSEYTKFKLNKDITIEELKGIMTLISMNVFNLRFAVLQAAIALDLNVVSAFDSNGILLKTITYENF